MTKASYKPQTTRNNGTEGRFARSRRTAFALQQAWSQTLPYGHSEQTPEGMSEARSFPESTDHQSLGLARRYRNCRALAVDYSLGMGLLGLFQMFLTPVLCMAVLLLFKMLWDIAMRWEFALTWNPLTAAAEMLNVLGACLLAVVAWLGFVILGAFVPLIDHFALPVALMTGTWFLGTAAADFFFNGFCLRLLPREAHPSHG